MLDRARMPALTVNDRLRISDPSSQTITLDGRPYRISSRRAYIFLGRLIKANGKVVSKPDLMKLMNMQEREWENIHTFLTDNLPKEVRSVVVGVRGPPGGYQVLFGRGKP
jgi:hypothetical protein